MLNGAIERLRREAAMEDDLDRIDDAALALLF
jgi:hypothetical protein